jgi:hypothetical protein
MTAKASSYYLALSVDVDRGEATVYLALYDEANVLLVQHRDTWVTFCWTWKDLVEYVERRWLAAGGELANLSRPSPYVDLT